MVKLTDLPYGHSLWADPDTGYPWVLRNGIRRAPAELAYTLEGYEARNVFREIKRFLDEADVTIPGWNLRHKAADLAKFAMEDALRKCGRWTTDLRENQIGIRV